MKQSKYKKYLLLLIPITIAVIWLMPKSCSHEGVKKSVNYLDTLDIKKKNEIVIHEHKENGYKRIIDSLKNVKNRVVVKYIKSRDEAKKDTSKAVQIFISNCDSMEIVNVFLQQYKDSIIDSKESIIRDKDDLILIEKQRTEQVRDSLKFAKTELKSTRKYWRGFKHGAVVGAILVESANVAAKLKL
jgi:hypothetical protein